MVAKTGAMAALTHAAAACPHFPHCAGCPLVGRPYAEQLAWKRAVVVRAMQEALPDAPIADVVAPVTVLVTLVTSRVDLDAAERVARRVRCDVPLGGLHVNENATTGNVIVGACTHRVWGEPELVERYGDVTLAAPATAFVQANTTTAARIYAAIATAANLRGHERVVDLYCGVGGIALTLAARADAVLGVEEIEPAVAAARR